MMWFTNFFFSWMTDMLIVKNILSPTNTRKFANSLGKYRQRPSFYEPFHLRQTKEKVDQVIQADEDTSVVLILDIILIPSFFFQNQKIYKFSLFFSGNIPAAIGLIALAFAPKNIYIVESILVFTCSFKIAAHLGFQVRIHNFTFNAYLPVIPTFFIVSNELLFVLTNWTHA